MNDKIEEGDVVSVNFNNAQITLCASAIVLHRPCATGDSWEFKDNKDGTIYCVSEGCTIKKCQKTTREE